MSSPDTPRKTAILLAPLVVSVLGLHAWGDGMAGGLNRALAGWQYPERSHPPFQIRVPRGSDADGFAAATLEEFIASAVRKEGALLGLRAPAAPVRVLLLDPEAKPGRFGLSVSDLPGENDGVFDADRRLILVRMGPKLQQEAVTGALRRAAARLLLADAGAAGWSPWFVQGLSSALEGSKDSDLHGWTGDLPTAAELLGASDAVFTRRTAPAYLRAARLIVAWLREARPEGFAQVCRAERDGTAARPGALEHVLGDFERLDTDWKAWVRRPK